MIGGCLKAKKYTMNVQLRLRRTRSDANGGFPNNLYANVRYQALNPLFEVVSVASM